MCERKSMIVVKGRTDPYWEIDNDSHAGMVERLKLKDEKLFGRFFVKVEVKPKADPFSQNPEDWEFCIDEEGTLPGWFEEDGQLWSDRCIHAMTKVIITQEKKSGRVGKLSIPKKYNKPLPWLKSVGGGLHTNSNAELMALKSVGGDLYINSNAELNAPKLKAVNGKPYKRGA